MHAMLSMLALCAVVLCGGYHLNICIQMGTSAEMLERITDHWMQSWPEGTTEIDGIPLTSHLHYVDLTGDANGDLRVDLLDFACVSQNWGN